jgi:hypothetical protein
MAAPTWSGRLNHPRRKDTGMPALAGTADVIVGDGSVGALLAARLSQNPARTVLPLLAG